MPCCPDHPNHELHPKKKGWYCAACDDVVLTYAECPRDGEAPTVAVGDAHAPDEAVPFPVAHPLHFARDACLSPSKRLNNAIFAAYQAMRVTAMLLLADYLASKESCPTLQRPIAGLRMPHWNEWSLLCDQLSCFWGRIARGAPERNTHFHALLLGWQTVNDPKGYKYPRWKPLLDGLPGNSGPARSANDAVWKARNDRAHRMATATFDDAAERQLLARLLPVVEAEVSVLFGAGEFSLLRCVSAEGHPLRAMRLHGSHPDLHFEAEPLDEVWRVLLQETGVAAVLEEDGVGIPLYPWFVDPEHDPGSVAVHEGGLTEPITLVDGVKEKSVVLLGVRSHGESSRIVGPLKQALARKQVDLGLRRDETTRWSLAAWSRATARETLETIMHRKYFPEVYLERQGVDDQVDAYAETKGRALLLLGEAGAGKTSILARLVDRLTRAAEQAPDDGHSTGDKRKDALTRFLSLRAHGDVVLFLSGRGAYAGDASATGRTLLCQAVLQKAGVRSDAFNDLADFVARLADSASQDTQQNRRVWIVLDALNEAERFVDLVKALDAFLPSLASAPWLRLVVSMRAGAYHSLKRRNREMAVYGRDVFDNAHVWLSFREGEHEDAGPYLTLRPFASKSEGEEAYRRRQARLPERAASMPYESLGATLQRLLLSPLYLHLFHETYRNTEVVPQDFDAAKLFAAYLDRLREESPGLCDPLRGIGKHMMDSGRPVLPLEVTDQWVRAWRGRQGWDSAMQVAKLDPFEELVAASVLLRPAEEGMGVDQRVVGLQFTHQKMCEHVLFEELERRLKPRKWPTTEEISAWAKVAAPAEPRAAHTEFSDRDRAVRERIARIEAKALAKLTGLPSQNKPLPRPEFEELTGALGRFAARLVEAERTSEIASVLDFEDEPVGARILVDGLRALGPASSRPGFVRWFVNSLTSEVSSSDAPRRHRFESYAREATTWLERAGYLEAGEELAAGRLRLMQTASANPDDLLRDTTAPLRDCARLAAAAGRADDAEAMWKQCESQLRVETRTLEFMGNQEVAMKSLTPLEERSVRRALSGKRRHLSSILGALGRMASAAKRGDDVRRCWAESLALMRAVVSADPGIPEFEYEFGESLVRMASTTIDDGRTEDAVSLLTESEVVLRRLCEEHPNREDFARVLSQARQLANRTSNG